jgi:hypothetical protein
LGGLFADNFHANHHRISQHQRPGSGSEKPDPVGYLEWHVLERQLDPAQSGPRLCHKNERARDLDLSGCGFHTIKAGKEKKMNNKMQTWGGCLPSDTLTSMKRIIAASITLLRRISNLRALSQILKFDSFLEQILNLLSNAHIPPLQGTSQLSWVESKLSCFFTKLICFKLLTLLRRISNLESKLSCFFTKLICFKLLMFLILATTAYSATYYVNGASGNDGNLGTIGSPWQTIHKANTTLVAGDKVYIRGGIYYVGQDETTSEGIHPYHSGTDANHMITYAVYPGEKVNLVGNDNTSIGVMIKSVDWINVTGHDGSTSAKNLLVTNMRVPLWIGNGKTWYETTPGSNYCEVSYCEFGRTNPYVLTAIDGGSRIFFNSSFNWIHHCSFHDSGGYDTIYDIAMNLDIGRTECGASNNGVCGDTTSNNVIENCELYHGGHHNIGIAQFNNVIRKNIFHNEQWFYYPQDGYWHGYRCILFTGGYNNPLHHQYNLFEENRISHSSENINGGKGGAGMHISSSNNIIRYNDIYANAGHSIIIESHSGGDNYLYSRFNHIYNNTMMADGYGATFPDFKNPPIRSNPPDRTPISIATGESSDGKALPLPLEPTMTDFAILWNNRWGDGKGTVYGNVIKNNLFNNTYSGNHITQSGNRRMEIVSGMYNYATA